MYLEEDSFFLSEELRRYLRKYQKNKKEIKILDLGAGSGIQSCTCLELGFKNILCADIDEKACKFLRKKFKNKVKVIKSDLFENIKGRFDLIIFNPPYLPENKFDSKLDTTGGKHGDETILKFLQQARNHLAERGKIILLLSSFTPRKKINQLIKKYYKKQELASKNLFFEKLEIWLLMLKDKSRLK